jgi:hypothetical protein
VEDFTIDVNWKKTFTEHQIITDKCKELKFEERSICKNECFYKSKDTSKYKTSDIILEIFITSLSHSEFFGQKINEIDVKKFYELLMDKEKTNILLNELTEMCKTMIQNKSEILLNPALGGKLEDELHSIPADADLVIDDKLIDIKCSVEIEKNERRNILQLLGYASLILLNNGYKKKINWISIINPIIGVEIIYDVGFITRENCISYIKLLSNELIIDTHHLSEHNPNNESRNVRLTQGLMDNYLSPEDK